MGDDDGRRGEGGSLVVGECMPSTVSSGASTGWSLLVMFGPREHGVEYYGNKKIQQDWTSRHTIVRPIWILGANF